MTEITKDFLRDNFIYENGKLIRKVAHGKRGRAGFPAGKKDPKGKDYVQIMINYRQYMAHRLIWLYFNGTWPSNHLDHINGDRLDNRIENLREATRSQNMGNQPIKKSNSSGYRGVSWKKSDRKWQVKFRGVYLGCFDDILEAAATYRAAYVAFYGEFARAA